MTQTNLATPTNAMPKGLLKGWILIVVAAIVAYSSIFICPMTRMPIRVWLCWLLSVFSG